jgi:hypothetical protein
MSRAAGLAPDERAVVDRWWQALEGMGLAPVSLTREEYRVPPWDQLRAVVGSCQGLVVLGFPARTTPWSQVEAGLGIMGGLPVLVVAEASVSGGVFDPGVESEGVTRVGLDAWKEGESGLDAWLTAVRG